MTIAFKSGRAIIKNSQLARACSCCGTQCQDAQYFATGGRGTSTRTFTFPEAAGVISFYWRWTWVGEKEVSTASVVIRAINSTSGNSRVIYDSGPASSIPVYDPSQLCLIKRDGESQVTVTVTQSDAKSYTWRYDIKCSDCEPTECPCASRCNYDFVVTDSDGFVRDITNDSCVLESDFWAVPGANPNRCIGGYQWLTYPEDGRLNTNGIIYASGSDRSLSFLDWTMAAGIYAQGTHLTAGVPLYPAQNDDVGLSVDAKAVLKCDQSRVGAYARYSLQIEGRMIAANARRADVGAGDFSWAKTFTFPATTIPVAAACETRANASCISTEVGGRKAMYFDLASKPLVITYSIRGVSVNGTLRIPAVVTGEEKDSNSAANCYLRYLEGYSITFTFKQREYCLNPLP